MKNQKNKKRLVLKESVQTTLEFIATAMVVLFVSSVDSEWTIGYFKFVAILGVIFTVCVAIIRKYGDLTKYE